MRTRTIIVGCCAAVLCALPSWRSAWGQVPDSTTLRTLQRRGEIRVTVGTDRTRVPGSAVQDAGIRLGTDSLLSWNHVSRAEVVRSPIGTGAAIGAVLGGLLGFAGSMSMTRDCEPRSWDMFCGADNNDVVLGTLGGAAAGAFVGLLIAAPFSGWRTVYDRRAGTGVGRRAVAPIVTSAAHGERRLGVRVLLRY